jgi:hypothetical protein
MQLEPFGMEVESKDALLERLCQKVFGAVPVYVQKDAVLVPSPEPECFLVPVETVEHQKHIREAANELCHALAERWFEPGDIEAQTARSVAAHKALSDLLMEGGGE